jgi:hypothetical protein
MAGLSAYCGNILSETTLENLDLGGLGRVLAVTSNDSVNVLALQRLARLFGKANVYQIAPTGPVNPDHSFGRPLFGKNTTCDALNYRIAQGGTIKATGLSDEFDYDTFSQRYDDPLVLFVIDEDGKLLVTTGAEDPPQPGQTVVSLVNEMEGEEVAAT